MHTIHTIQSWIKKIIKKIAEIFGHIDGVITVSNAQTLGTHAGSLTCLCQSDIAQAGLLVSATAPSSLLGCTPADGSTWPIGVAHSAAKRGDTLAVTLLGSAPHTLNMISAGALTAGQPVYSASGGLVQSQPTTPGTYYRVGLALTHAQAAYTYVEVDPTSACPVTLPNTQSCNHTL